MGTATCSSGCLWKEQNLEPGVCQRAGRNLAKRLLLESCNRAEVRGSARGPVRGSARGPGQAAEQESEWETMILWVKLGQLL